MKSRFGVVALAVLIAATAVSVFGAGTLVRPQRLEAQGCGRFDGLLCAADCTRECTNGGGCCAWSFYYYIKTSEQ